MKLTDKQAAHIAGLRAMADYLEEHPLLTPPRTPTALLVPWGLDETIALLKEQGEPLVETGGYVSCDHDSFKIQVYLPSIAKVTVQHSGLVPPVAKVLADAEKATAKRLAAEALAVK